MSNARDKHIVFYDGGCGFCHTAVLFLLSNDRGGKLLFAPLQGETFRQMLSEEQRQGLPDSLVVLTPAGDLHLRSRAVLYAMKQLGGPWRSFAIVSGIVPAFLSDIVYRIFAVLRRKLFSKPEGVCPVVPREMQMRFLP